MRPAGEVESDLEHTHTSDGHIAALPPPQEETRALPPPDEKRAKWEKRKHWLKWAIPIFLAILLAIGYIWWHGRDRESTDDAQVNGHIAPVSARVDGTVAEVLVDDNWNVKAGQVLARIDPRDYQARVDQAKAALAAAEEAANAAQVAIPVTRGTTASSTSGAQANLQATIAQANQAAEIAHEAETADIEVAQAAVAQAEANNTKAQADQARMAALVAKDEVSRQQYDAYVAQAKVAAEQVRSAQQQLRAAQQRAANARDAAAAAQAKVGQARATVAESRANQQQVVVQQAQAKSAAARIQQARADLEAAELQLSYCTITAPISGVVTEKNVEPGQRLQPGEALLTIIPLKDVWVTANFKETQMAQMRPGDAAEVKVDMYGDEIWGRVDSIAGATGARTSLLPPENATGNFVKVVQRIPVKIVFDHLPSGVVLRPGMNVDATVITDKGQPFRNYGPNTPSSVEQRQDNGQSRPVE